MSKRNFVLLIIILVIILLAVFGFLYFRGNTGTPDDTGGTNFGSPFNPFGSGSGQQKPPVGTPPDETPGEDTTPGEEVVKPKLIKVSSMPVAGFTVYQKERLKEVPVPIVETTTPETTETTTTKPVPPPTEFAPALRYVDRVSGNIYQTFADKLEEKRFSTTVIPKIYEALFGNNGESVVMRYLRGDNKTVVTFVGNLPKEILGEDTTDTNEVKGTFLPDDVKDVSLSGDASSIFYLFNVGENTIGTTLNLQSNKKAQILDSAFNEWLSSYPNSKLITMTTKPSSGVLGYMYVVDPTSANKSLTKALGGVNGLTTLTSPNGKLVLYGNNSLSLSIYHLDTKVSDPFGLNTMPEKCVWGKMSDTVYCAMPKSISGGGYPDNWYQGEVSFSDQIWKIDVVTGNATLLADPLAIDGGEDIDGIKLALDQEENYLFFVNKKDSFLWELNLE